MRIVIDSREQKPFDFLQCGLDIEVVNGSLDTGDYSLSGFENAIAVERKSLSDLVSCLGSQRERFAREMMRARALQSFCVVCEGSYTELASGAYRSNLNPASACASVAAFTSRLGIPFAFCGSRDEAERFTALFLRQWLRGKERELKAVEASLKSEIGARSNEQQQNKQYRTA